MSLKLYCYDFSKRVKSTLRPDNETVYGEYDIVFKQSTNIMKPDFIINTGGIYPTATYCKLVIPINESVDKTFYYFIDSITALTNTDFALHCSLDSLATTKESILATEAFVIYSSSDYNRWMKDERIPIVIKGSEVVNGSSAIISSAYDVPVFDADINGETIILSAISADMGLMHYVIDEDVLQDIAASLAGTDIQQFLDDLMQQFGDAVGSIIQIRRIPVNKAALNTISLGTIYLGGYEVSDRTHGNPIPATYLNTPLVNATGSISIPLTHTDFRWTEPYCTARMSLPFVGIVDISISDFPNGSIHWAMILDVVSGSVVYTLANDSSDGKPVATYSGECGMLVPIASAQIANTSSIVTSAASGVAGLVGGSASGNPAAILGGIMGITQAFTATLQKSTSIIGSYSGTRSEFLNTKIRIMVEKYATALEPADLINIEGRPCCKVLSLAALTGYCRTKDFQLTGSWLKDIKDEVNALLDSGIYIE